MKIKTGIVIMYVFLLILFSFAILRLYMTAFGENTSQVLSGQYSRKIEVAERRGAILDRNGRLLNLKQDGYILLVIPDKCTNPKNEAEKLSEISRYSHSEILEKILRGVPFTIKASRKYTSDAVCSYTCYNSDTLCAPHIVGYTDASGRGASGIEKYYDSELSDTYSGKVSYSYSADALGRFLEDSSGALTDNGYEVIRGVCLTIDRDIQRYIEKLVKQYPFSGAVCVTDTLTGEIYAGVSFPGFDTGNVADYLESDRGELVNRCTSGFTPGSIFKTAVAAAALEYDIGLYDYEYICEGSYITEDGELIPCHKKGGHGTLTMKEAYAQSCNPYFIKLAHITGTSRIIETAGKMLGVNNDIDGIFKTYINLPEYNPALSSSGGYTANLAIGQGKTLISPISACTMFSSAVTGVYSKPTLLYGNNLKKTDNTVSEGTGNRILSADTSEKLLEMMINCVKNGLGKDAAPENTAAGGKTATAQTGIIQDGKEMLNCWFCGVFPAELPEYTVCVLVCDSENRNVAKEIFRKICDYIAKSNK